MERSRELRYGVKEDGGREKWSHLIDWEYSSPDLLRYEPDNSDFFLKPDWVQFLLLEIKAPDKFICLFKVMATL